LGHSLPRRDKEKGGRSTAAKLSTMKITSGNVVPHSKFKVFMRKTKGGGREGLKDSLKKSRRPQKIFRSTTGLSYGEGMTTERNVTMKIVWRLLRPDYDVEKNIGGPLGGRTTKYPTMEKASLLAGNEKKGPRRKSIKEE